MLFMIFSAVVNASLRASLIILIVLAIRVIAKERIKAFGYILLWGIVCIRLFVPWLPQSQFSLFNFFNTKQESRVTFLDHTTPDTIRTHGVPMEPLPTAQEVMHKPVPPTDGFSNTEYISYDEPLEQNGNMGSIPQTIHTKQKNPISNTAYNWLFLLWLTGFMLWAGYYLTVQLVFNRMNKQKIKITDRYVLGIADECKQILRIRKKLNLYETIAISQPCLYGMVKPMLLFPCGLLNSLNSIEIKHILMHELVHYKRKDHCLNLFVTFIKTIHWFNPLVHYALQHMKKDVEYACDDIVIAALGHCSMQEYGRTLLKLACRKPYGKPVLAAGIGVKRKNITERVYRMTYSPKNKFLWTMITVILITFVGCTGLSNEIDDIRLDKLEPKTLTIVVPGNQPVGMSEVLAKIEERSAAELNINLKFHFIPFGAVSYYDQVMSLMSSGQSFDALMMPDDNRAVLEELVQNNLVADITHLFPQYAPGIYSALDEKMREYVKVDGKLYAIPRLYPIVNRMGVVVRDDLLKKYGFTSIHNYDQLETFLEKIKQNEPDLFPLSITQNSLGLFAQAYGYAVMDYQMGLVYKWNDKDMKLQAWEQTPEFKEAENRLAYWYRRGYITPGHATRPDERMIASGKWAVIIENMGNTVEYNFTNEIKEGSQGYTYSEYALYPDKKAPKLTTLLFSFVVNSQSANQERFLMFLDWVHANEENYRLLRYGLEGRDYKLVNNCLTAPDTLNSLRQAYVSWFGGNAFMNMKLDGPYWINGKAFDMQGYWENLSVNSDYVPHAGFVPDFTPVKQIEITRRMSFTNLIRKMETGTFQDRDIEDYIEDMRRGDTDLLVKTIQQQLDEWRSKP